MFSYNNYLAYLNETFYISVEAELIPFYALENKVPYYIDPLFNNAEGKIFKGANQLIVQCKSYEIRNTNTNCIPQTYAILNRWSLRPEYRSFQTFCIVKKLEEQYEFIAPSHWFEESTVPFISCDKQQPVSGVPFLIILPHYQANKRFPLENEIEREFIIDFARYLNCAFTKEPFERPTMYEYKKNYLLQKIKKDPTFILRSAFTAFKIAMGTIPSQYQTFVSLDTSFNEMIEIVSRK